MLLMYATPVWASTAATGNEWTTFPYPSAPNQAIYASAVLPGSSGGTGNLVVSAQNGIYEYANGSWTKLGGNGQPSGVAATTEFAVDSAGDLFAVGTNGNIHEYSNGAWSLLTPFTSGYPEQIAVSAGSTPMLYANFGAGIYQYSLTASSPTWTPLPPSPSDAVSSANSPGVTAFSVNPSTGELVVGTAADNVYGWTPGSSSWSTLGSSLSMTPASFAFSSSGGLYVTGSGNVTGSAVEEYSGGTTNAWSPVTSTGSSALDPTSGQAMAMTSGGNPVDLGRNNVWEYASGNWSSIATVGTPASWGYSAFVDAIGSTIDLVTRDNGVWQYNGSSWSDLPSLPGPNPDMGPVAYWNGAWYSGSQDSSAPGPNSGTGLWQWSGSAWQQAGGSSPVSSYQVTGVYPDGSTLYVVSNSNVWSYNGTAWTSLGSVPGSAQVSDLAFSGSNVYASTSAGLYDYAAGSGTSSWSLVGGSSTPVGASAMTSVAVYNGDPVVGIAGSIGSTANPGVYEYTTSNGWLPVGGSTGPLAGQQVSSLVMSPSGLLTVGIVNSTSQSAVWQWDGTSWTAVGSVGTDTSTPTGVAALAYSPTGTLGALLTSSSSVAQYTSGSWTTLAAQQGSMPTSLAYSSAGTLGVSLSQQGFSEYSPIAITAASLTNAVVGQSYSVTLAATGGSTPYTWALSTGSSLPSGLSLSSSGTLSGTPASSDSGSYSFSAQVTDSQGNVAFQTFSLDVVTGNATVTAVTPNAAVGGTITITGTNFGNAPGAGDGVWFPTFSATTQATIQTWSPTQIVATVPSSAVSGSISLIVGGNSYPFSGNPGQLGWVNVAAPVSGQVDLPNGSAAGSGLEVAIEEPPASNPNGPPAQVLTFPTSSTGTFTTGSTNIEPNAQAWVWDPSGQYLPSHTESITQGQSLTLQFQGTSSGTVPIQLTDVPANQSFIVQSVPVAELDSSSGVTIPNAGPVVESSSGGTVNVTLPNPPGNAALEVFVSTVDGSAPVGAVLPQPATASPGSTATVFPFVNAPYTITGQLTQNGSGVAYAWVSAFAPPTNGSSAGFSNGTLTDANGDFTLPVSVAGTYTVNADATGLPPSTTDTVTVGSNASTATANLQIQNITTGITGTVTLSGAPVPGSFVSAWSSNGNYGSATPASDGTYTIYVPPGTYQVSAYIPGYGPVTENNVTVTSSTPVAANFKETSATMGSISGTMTVNGLPVANAMVWAIQGSSNQSTSVATTDSSGNYTLLVPVGSTYQVYAQTPEGYVFSPLSETVSSSTGVTGANFSQSMATVTVEVTGPNGVLEQNAFVTMAGSGQNIVQGITGSNGTAMFTVPIGSYAVSATVPGMNFPSETETVTSGANTVDLTDNQTLVTISGTVKDGSTPIAGAQVLISGTNGTVTASTSSTGAYSIQVPALSGYAASVEAPNYIDSTSASSENNLTFTQATATLNFTMVPTSDTISGTVSGSSGPVGDATVWATNTTSGALISTLTGADGTFSLPVSSGTWSVSVSALGYQNSSAQLVTLSSTTTTQSLTINLTAQSGYQPVAPSSAMVSSTQGSVVKNSALGVSASVPAGTLSSGTVQVAPAATPGGTAGLSPVSGSGTMVTATNTSGQNVQSLQQPITLTMTLTASQIQASGISSVSQLTSTQIGYVSPTTGAWVSLPTTVALYGSTGQLLNASSTSLSDVASAVLTANVQHLTKFAALAPTGVPAITSISPTSGPAGTTVTITGTNLGSVDGVLFGNQSATNVTVVSSTEVTAIAPSGSGTVSVVATAPSGNSTGSATFTYGAAAPEPSPTPTPSPTPAPTPTPTPSPAPSQPTVTVPSGTVPIGQPVTVSVSGGSSGDAYQFWIESPRNGTWSSSGSYSSSSSFALNEEVPGTYVVQGFVTGPNLKAPEALAPVTVTVATSAPMVSGLKVGSTQSGVLPAGSSDSIQATATDSGKPEYQFWIHNSTGWHMVQNYSANSSLDLTSLKAGSYAVAVYSLDASQVANRAWNQAYSHTVVVNVGSKVSMTTGSAAAGGSLSLTAQATGLTNAQYQFWYETPSGTWIASGNYSSQASFSIPSLTAGTYHLVVYAKDPYAPSTAQYAVVSHASVTVP